MIGPLFKTSKVRNRVGLANYLNEQGLVGHGAEIGVWLGHYAIPFLDAWKGQRLYLVDPWTKFPQSEYDDIRNTDFKDEDYHEAVKAFERFGDRASIVRMTSTEAAETIAVPLDFVYIDANHSYKYISADLELWWNKLSDRAVLAGHDLFAPDHPDVTQALMEFALRKDLTVYIVPGDYNRHRALVNYHSWYINKGF